MRALLRTLCFFLFLLSGALALSSTSEPLGLVGIALMAFLTVIIVILSTGDENNVKPE